MLRTQADGVRVRSEPSSSAEVLAALPVGAMLSTVGGRVNAEGFDWYEVRIAADHGWVAAGPDGDWLAVVRNGAIGFGTIDQNDERPTISVEADGSDRRVLLGAFGSPFWSPDGSRVAIQYTAAADSQSHIVVVDADGGDAVPLGTGYEPAWSPDGSRLAWTDPAQPGGIGLWERDGEPIRVLVNDHGGVGSVAWSPDGSRLAFVAIDCPECPVGEPIAGEPPMALWVFEPPGGAVIKLADGGWGGGVAWSPDGSAITFSEFDFGTGGFEVRLLDLDSGDVSVIATHETTGYGHAISPDWSRLVLGTAQGIVVSDLDGTDPVVVVPTSLDTNPMAQNPRWSPDGEWILYDLVWITGDAIYPAVVRVDGTDARTLGDIVGYGASWQPILEALP